MDRRRRAIRESLVTATGDSTDEGRVSPSRTSRSQLELPELTKKERGVAYSHSVRRACQHRLVQFIPIRKLSLTGAVAGSLAVPFLLMTLHYLVFVSGTLDWAGHPMSALLNASNPRSLAAWFSSHLWLLCLAATVLTFRLRKHKLDDYDGEYRLWFWLVFTCVIGSIDSTTRLTDLFGAALDRWSQLHIGWTGGAVVQATLATLIGLLGLRLCSELKSMPTSLVFWLVGLVCWAGSAALSQSVLKLDMTPAMRTWLRATLWMGGLTSIWLCGLFYLRSIFMEAQKRFLSRAIMNNNAVPWSQRIRESMPAVPKMPTMGWRRRNPEDSELQAQDAANGTQTRRKKSRVASEGNLQRDPGQRDTGQRNQQDVDERDDRSENRRQPEPDQSATQTKRRWGLGGLMLKPPNVVDAAASVGASGKASEAAPPRSAAAQDAEVDREYGKRPGWFRRGSKNAVAADATSTGEPVRKAVRDQLDSGSEPAEKRSLRDRLRWKRRETVDEEDGDPNARNTSKPSGKVASRPRQRDDIDQDDEAAAKPKRKWLSMPRPKMPKVSMPKISLPKPKLPKLKLPSFRLPPPGANDDLDDQPQGSSANTSRVPPINTSRPLPSTSHTSSQSNSSRPVPTQPGNDSDSDNSRGLSKSERKRLKRMQRDDEGDRRAA